MRKTLPLQRNQLTFILIFLLFAGVGLGILALIPEHSLRVHSQQLHAKVCAVLLDTLDPELHVSSKGALLHAAGRPVVHVTEECDGLETMVILCAAILAYSFTPRGVLAALGGIALLFAGNVLRIMVLFHLYRTNQSYADMVHLYAGPLFTILPGLAWFLFIAPRLRKPPESP